jgi:hypothetical protein
MDSSKGTGTHIGRAFWRSRGYYRRMSTSGNYTPEGSGTGGYSVLACGEGERRTSLGNTMSEKQGYIFVWLRTGYRSVVKSALALYIRTTPGQKCIFAVAEHTHRNCHCSHMLGILCRYWGRDNASRLCRIWTLGGAGLKRARYL